MYHFFSRKLAKIFNLTERKNFMGYAQPCELSAGSQIPAADLEISKEQDNNLWGTPADDLHPDEISREFRHTNVRIG
jgi:hypothetical protein